MTQYQAPLKDMQFVLHSLLRIQETLAELPDYASVDADTINQILDEAGKFTGQVLSPLNAVGDQQGCKLAEDGSVKTPDGFRDAYQQFVEAGWPSLSADPEFDGQGLPAVMQIPVNEMIYGANQAWGMYSGLTLGAYKCLSHFGTPEQKKTYLPKMGEGRWTGTMCLTESQAGTDLGILRTRAEPVGDGSYKLSGTKIFISAGEHDMSENIVHLVLARLPDAPAGTRGISLFLVPRQLPDAQGEAGERNAIRCGALEHKMGINGNATCVMNLEGATGWLIGEPNRGLQAMFLMMNEARLGVGLEGLGISEGAYQKAVAYARDRLQGRAPTGERRAGQVADPIIQHPDVRRMLLTQKAYIEGGRALAYWTAMLVDVEAAHPDREQAARAGKLVEFLTPVVKAFLTDNGMICTNLAIQCFGGHGYIRETGVEQYFRDVRIKPIYEGTNGIQAMDLLGRKVLMDGGERLGLLVEDIQHFLQAHAEAPHVLKYQSQLTELMGEIGEITKEIGDRMREQPAEAGAAASDYLRCMGHLIFGYLWLRSCVAAQQQLDTGRDQDFAKAKLATAQFYFSRLFPETRYHLEAARAGADSVMALAEAAF